MHTAYLLVLCGTLALTSCSDTTEHAPTEVVNETIQQACTYDRVAMMALDFWTFDQDPHRGWRKVEQTPGCELEAADLLRDYHALLRKKGEPIVIETEQGSFTYSATGEIGLLYWHEGQVRVFQGQTDEAIQLFRQSLRPEDKNVMGWNEYARATIAFLEGDRALFDKERAALAGAAPGSLNLGVVDGLRACFDRTYKEAYSSEECDKRPKRN